MCPRARASGNFVLRGKTGICPSAWGRNHLRAGKATKVRHQASPQQPVVNLNA
jgi:hypothetical protein